MKYQDTCDQRHHDYNQKGRLQKNNVTFWQNFFSYKYTRLSYGILCRENKREGEIIGTTMRTGKKANDNRSSKYHPTWQTP